MTVVSSVVICCSYILGLLLTALPGTFLTVPVEAIALLVMSGLASFFMPRIWRAGPRSRVWLLAGLIGILAVTYFNLRLPRPGEQDISQQLANTSITTPAQTVQVYGKISSPPRLTRSQRVQFWLRVSRFHAITSPNEPAVANQVVTGNLYVTVPLLLGTGLYPDQTLNVTGTLYQPKPADSPGGFDFQAYLARQGGFAGLSGNQIEFPAGEERSPPLLWSIRQRIVQSQVQALGSREGALISAMVLGRRAVDLAYEIQDQFSQIGLAHTLAASGFHVSLLLGLVLTCCRHLSPRQQAIAGGLTLFAYVSLTGIQPSVLRAALMGLGALLGMVMDRRVNSLGALLLAATLLLLFNPLWIWDLGFQLSFLATLGLLVTVPTLKQWLDWLPVAIATLFAVPIAAYIWTLPLQLYAFGVVSPYSIPVNIITTLLVTAISLGGMVSALAAIAWPQLGSLLASFLHYPTAGLLAIVNYCTQLPGNSIATGTISSLQVGSLYGLFLLIWWQVPWRKYWWIASAAGLAIVAMPIWYASNTIVQVTVFPVPETPVIVIRDKEQTILINGGSENTARFTILPFLRQSGINQLTAVIATDFQPDNLAGLYQVSANQPIQRLYGNRFGSSEDDSTSANPGAADGSAQNQTEADIVLQSILETLPTSDAYVSLETGQATILGQITAQFIHEQHPTLELQIGDQSWLLLDDLSTADQQMLITSVQFPAANVLWWSGEVLLESLLDFVQPDVAIAASKSVGSDIKQWFEQQSKALYVTNRDGAIQWSPEQGFTTTVDLMEQTRGWGLSN